jgi:hypothetical protein
METARNTFSSFVLTAVGTGGMWDYMCTEMDTTDAVKYFYMLTITNTVIA